MFRLLTSPLAKLMRPRDPADSTSHDGWQRLSFSHLDIGEPRTPYLLGAILTFTWLLATLPILLTPFVMTNDGFEHLYAAWIYWESDQLSAAERSLVLFHWPWAGGVTTAILGPLLALLPWQIAWKSFVVLQVTLMHAGMSTLILRVRPVSIVALLSVPPLATGWLFLTGFYNFYTGMAFGLMLIASTMAMQRWTWRQTLGISASLLFISLCHSLAAVLTGLLLTLQVLSQATRQPSLQWAPWLRLVLSGLPCFLLVLSTSLLHEQTLASTTRDGVRWIVDTHWTEFFQVVVPGSFPLVLWLPALALTGLISAAWQAWKERANPRPATLALLLGGLLLAALWGILPYSIPTWEVISPRPAPFAILMGLLLLPFVRHPLVLCVVCLQLAFSIHWSWSLYRFQSDVQMGCHDVLQELDQDNDRELYQGWLAFRGCTDTNGFAEIPSIHRIHFTKHLPAALAVANRALHQGFHSVPPIHTHTLFTRHDLMPGRRPDPNYLGLQIMGMRNAGYSIEQMRPVIFDIHERAATWDHTWVFGAPDIFESAFPAHDFQTLQQTGDLTLVRFVGCPLSIALPASDAPLRVEHGWVPRPFDAPFQRVSVPPRTNSLELARTTCGPIWVRLYDDATGNDVPCSGATAMELQQSLGAGTPRQVNCQ